MVSGSVSTGNVRIGIRFYVMRSRTGDSGRFGSGSGTNVSVKPRCLNSSLATSVALHIF